MTPYLQDADVTLYHGDALAVLSELPAESVDCCVTSPPYWGLRDYGTPGQLGLEPTPEEYVTRMVEVFREVRRVLASHGTVWLNLGDSYAGSWGAQSRPNGNDVKTTLEGGSMLSARQIEAHPRGQTHTGSLKNTPDLKPKDLVGIPWRVAFALQADGWYLRSDIIWAKPNPMPESVTDRPTKAHEYVFLLSKQPRYFFDQEAVRESYKYDGRKVTTVQGKDGSIQHRNGERWPGIGKASHAARASLISHGHDENEPMEINHAGRNIRSVWEIATQPYPEAHFATFPEELARRCIAAGTSERGKCPECGASWVRGTDRTTTGWQPTCLCRVSGQHNQPVSACSLCLPHVPAVVLDPFMGSGTVAYVARKLDRHAVGIDLSAEYLALAAKRLQQQSLFALDTGAERSPSAERTQGETEDSPEPLSRAEASG